MTNWSGINRTTEDPKPCDFCGELTNTPGACFTCFHEPFGIGWQMEMEERFADARGEFREDGLRY
jgi:hypothetical protein